MITGHTMHQMPILVNTRLEEDLLSRNSWRGILIQYRTFLAAPEDELNLIGLIRDAEEPA